MARRAAFLVVLAAAAVSGCLWSRLERRTIDVGPFWAWAGQTGEVPADSLRPALVPVSSHVPEMADGSLEGIEEIALFAQIQNVEQSPVPISIYAHRRQLTDVARIRSEGIRLLGPVLVDGRSALQIDARNYPTLAVGFEDVAELARDGDFYLYVIGENARFRVNANVPSITLLVTID